jgi:hypothetical protein
MSYQTNKYFSPKIVGEVNEQYIKAKNSRSALA